MGEDRFVRDFTYKKEDVERDLAKALLDHFLRDVPEEEREKKQHIYSEILRSDSFKRLRINLQKSPGKEPEILSQFMDTVEPVAEIISRLRDKVDYDELTGVYRRDAFALRYEAEASVLKEKKKGTDAVSAVVFIDLDKFKSINDNYGHGAGDVALKGIAELLKNTVRAGDAVCRNGGDEFMLLLTDIKETEVEDDGIKRRITATEAVPRAINRILKKMMGHVLVKDGQENDFKLLARDEAKKEPKRFEIIYDVSLSLGVKILNPEDEVPTLEGVRVETDSAAYTTKESGRGGVTYITGKKEDGTLTGKTYIHDSNPPREIIQDIKKESESEFTIERIEKEISKSLEVGRVYKCVKPAKEVGLMEKVKIVISDLAKQIFDCCKD